MRRLLVAIAVLGLSVAAPAATRAEGGQNREFCETYCTLLSLYCYITAGKVMGNDKCDMMYEGCIAGCLGMLAQTELQEKEK